MTSQPILHITRESALVPAIRSWEVYLRDQGKSPHTVKAFLGDLNLFANYLSPQKPIGEITTPEINHFLDWLENERGVPCSPKSLARRVTSIKAFFRWLFVNGRISIDPAEKVLQKSVISPLPEVLTQDEIEKVRFLADTYRSVQKPDSRPAALFVLLLETGIKKGECLNLAMNHIDLGDDHQPFVFIRYANPSNRYKERKIELSEDWIRIFREFCLQYDPKEKVFPWSPRRLEYILEDLGRDAGLQKHLSFDMCRWTAGLIDWKNGVPAETIRQKMGISKIQWREIGMKLKQLSEK
jgi:site-specific recombinase XerD